MGVVDFPQVNRVSAEVRDAREASDVIPEWPPNKQKLQIGDWEGVRSPFLLPSPAHFAVSARSEFSSSQGFRSLVRSFRFKKCILLLQESIAYFPLVILISGVFSSLGAKKLDKMVGAKVRRKGKVDKLIELL